MICHGCGREIPDNLRFCKYCGIPVQKEYSGASQDDAVTKFCMSCGAALKPGVIFCTRCGTPVGNSSAGNIDGGEKLSQSSDMEDIPTIVETKRAGGSVGKYIIALLTVVSLILVGIIAVFFANKFGLIGKLKNRDDSGTIIDEDMAAESAKSSDDNVESTGAVENNEAADAKDGNVGIPQEDNAKDMDVVGNPTDKEKADSELMDDDVDDEKELEPENRYDPARHNYEFFQEDVTWTEAKHLCEEKGGHLVTFYNEEEWNTVTDYLSFLNLDYSKKPMHIWIGAYCDGQGSDGTCRIKSVIDGQGGISNWYKGEPNHYDPNTGDEERYIKIVYMSDDNAGYFGNWVWMDNPEDISSFFAGRIGYICEYDQ